MFFPIMQQTVYAVVIRYAFSLTQAKSAEELYTSRVRDDKSNVLTDYPPFVRE